MIDKKYKTIGDFIKTKREGLSLKQEDLAEKIGVASSTISLYESGKRKPDLDTLRKISGVLGVSLAELIEIEVPKENLDISLRAQGLNRDDIDEVKGYISYIKQEKMRRSRSSIRKEVNNLLKTCSINEGPVNLATIIRTLGITAEKIHLPDKENFDAVIESEDKILVFNSSQPYVRRRFSIAHEIGHLILGHKGCQKFDMNSKDPNEVESNIFSAELLMPFEWIKADLKKGLNVNDIAEKYKVSEEAVGWRLFNSNSLLSS